MTDTAPHGTSSTREHARCPGCEGCATCGVHTAGVTCNGTLKSQRREAAADDRELLRQAAEALWKCAKSALTVKPVLDTPYEPPYEEWTPYTRWVERPAREAHDLAVAIRKHLRETP